MSQRVVCAAKALWSMKFATVTFVRVISGVSCRDVYEGRYESIASNFFLENVTALTMKFAWFIHTYFAIMRLFFHKATVIFNTFLPTLS
jgi:hypothetical protein